MRFTISQQEQFMNNLTLLYRAPWDFDLYLKDDSFIMTVVFSEYNNFSQMEVFRSFSIQKETLIQHDKLGNLAELAKEIRETYDNNIWTEIKPHVFISGKGTVAKYNDPMMPLGSIL